MAKQDRFQTKYPGVYFIIGTAADGRPEKIYYIRYRRNGEAVEEKAGRQFNDDMTPARAAGIRTERIEGKQRSNQERREAVRAAKGAEDARWTIAKLWLQYQKTNPEVKGIGRDEDRFNCYIKDSLGLREPSELLPLDVDRLRIRHQKTLSPATVRNVLELLRRIINFGVKKQLCTGLSFTIQMPRVNNLKTEDLTPDQWSALLKAIDEDENTHVANIMRLALFTGMRKGELFKIQWPDVDFERGFIHIRDPKGGPDQIIPINDAAREILKSIPEIKGSTYVFPGKDKGARRNAHRVVNRIKARAGLPAEFRPLHGLRHVYASMLASSGDVDMFTLQKLLTHKSPQMTQRYAHLRDEALKKAAGVANGLIESAKKQGRVVSLQKK